MADIAHGLASDLQHLPRFGGDQIDPLAAMPHQNAPGIRQIVGVERAQQRALAAAGGAGQHHALARRDGEMRVGEHRQLHTALGVQGKGLGEGFDL